MCLFIPEKQFAIATAKENTPCYKALDDNNFFKRAQSQHTGHRYSKYKIEDEPSFKRRALDAVEYTRNSTYDKDYVEINQGFHSRIPRKSLLFENASHLFVIPQGAEYVTGCENDQSSNSDYFDNYVSDKIIYCGRNNAFNRWIAKLLYNVTFEPCKKD
jgi:hypothetical protein